VIKLAPSLKAMPPLIRRMIIEDVYRGVTLTNVPPDKKSKEQMSQVLSFAAVNKDFRKEVMGYVFTRKNVKVVCNKFGAILFSPQYDAGLGLFKWFRQLNFSVKDIAYFIKPSRKQASMSSLVFPNLRNLHAEFIIDEKYPIAPVCRQRGAKRCFADRLISQFILHDSYLSYLAFVWHLATEY
jgi:hypothetical protein